MAFGKIFLMHSIKGNFDKVLSILNEIINDRFLLNTGNILRPGPKPKFTDIEVMALSLTAECMGIDSENLLFSKLNTDYKEDFPYLISRRQFNDRRKDLLSLIEEVRKKMASKLNELTEIFTIDSMPLEVCKLSRMQRNKISVDFDYQKPDKGFCASQNRYVYGYKLHGLCSPAGIVQEFDLTKASIHDINYLKDIGELVSNCIITGDRGYINSNIKKQLFEKASICMEVPGRSNQKNKAKVMYELRKIRKRIETVFSQLCDQFMIQRNYAKSFRGYKARILSKITGLTILQYINKFVRGTPIGQIKYSLSYSVG